MKATQQAINGIKANVKQNETKEQVVKNTYFQNLKCYIKNTCMFHLILVGVLSGLKLSVRNSGWVY